MTIAGLSFRRCAGCRSLWAENPPEDELSAGLYDDARYFNNPDYGPPDAGSFHGYRDYMADRAPIEAKFGETLAWIERFVEPGLLLDVGAGPGFLLSAARERGWDGQGLDLNPWAAAYARDQLGILVAQERLESAAFEEASFDAVTMMDLLEHVSDPDALIAESARVTRPGGILALLTPDAGSIVSRALGCRWPEIQRAGEHLVLLSVKGASCLVARHGYEVLGWHSVGKTSSAITLLADVAPALPAVARIAGPLLRATGRQEQQVSFDPHTKFVLYARRRSGGDAGPVSGRRLTGARLPKSAARASRATEIAILEELHTLARARRLCEWMFAQFSAHAHGVAVEVGAGIGTFSARLLAGGVDRLLLIEPETACADELERRFGQDSRVAIVRELLPESLALADRASGCDFVLCQNVLEHIEADAPATAAMARALRPGGTLTLLVPARPELFGTLDVTYGHWRRYTPQSLRSLVEGAGLEVIDLHYFNALGVPGWWLKNRVGSAAIGPLALRAYEALLIPWQAVERRARPPFGLSLIVHARRIA